MTEVAEMNIAAMSDTELKSSLHTLIERTEKRAQLELYAEILHDALDEKEDWWEAVPAEHRARILTSYKESFDPKNWVSHEEARKRHAKWLKK